MRRCVTAAIAAAVVWLVFDFVPAAAQRALTPVTDAMLRNPDPADWLMWRRTLNSWGYSPLDQIDRGNVARLQLIWSRPLGPGLQEGTPLVHDGVMFMPNPADFIQAMNAATGDLLWEYKRKWPDDVTKVFPVPGINRNLAIYGTTIIDTSADDYVFALDAMSGELLVGDPDRRFQKERRPGNVRPDYRERQDHFHARL